MLTVAASVEQLFFVPLHSSPNTWTMQPRFSNPPNKSPSELQHTCLWVPPLLTPLLPVLTPVVLPTLLPVLQVPPVVGVVGIAETARAMERTGTMMDAFMFGMVDGRFVVVMNDMIKE